MMWYEIVLLFMVVGSVCVCFGILTGLEVKRYKAQIKREVQLTEMLEVLCWCLGKSKVTVTSDPKNIFEDHR